jgi:Glyoxalase-like domain
MGPSRLAADERKTLMLELDHIFIMSAAGAPEATALVSLGVVEGPGNTHPGQGTACRRFFFEKQYLELLWVSDPDEARNEATRRTRLWDRWSARRSGACPFGIVLRSRDDREPELPFPTLPYTPSYLLNGFTIHVAVETPLTEPEFFVLGFPRGHAPSSPQPHPGAVLFNDLTEVRIGTVGARPLSAAAQWAAASGLLSFDPSDEYVLRMTFDGGTSGKDTDLRPVLPLTLRW